MAAKRNRGTKIFLASWLYEKSQKKSLDIVGHDRRLLSYYHTRDKVEDFKVYKITNQGEAK